MEKKYLKHVVILLLLGIVVLSIVFKNELSDVLTSFLETVRDLGVVGGLLFALVYAIATVAFIPGSILTLGAGFIFTATNDGNQLAGTLIATTVVFAGASTGATLAFLVARFVFRDTVSQWVAKYKTFAAIDTVIESKGLRIVLLLRLSPVIPFNALNYLLGTTAVAFRDYVIALLGLLPGTMAFCFIGSTLSSLNDTGGGAQDDSAKTVQTVVLVVGGLFTLAAVFGISFYAKKELNKQLKANTPAETDTTVTIEP